MPGCSVLVADARMTAEYHSDTSSRAGDRTRLRTFAASVGLLALAIAQSPGYLIADTKLDLVVNPDGMLMRSLTMWDPQGAAGQVGNQSYGYLWPMGPFFWLGEIVAPPDWLLQRLWIGLVLVVAFQGAWRLARALGLRSDLALVVTGVAYALSPRMVTTVGPISIEAWPSALAPWVLLALVLGSRQGSARRYALGAGLGVAMVGGVNAAASFAVIPLGAVWLLTRARGPRRRTLMTWWPIFTLLGCLWWLVPLVLLGRYSPPFLDYIETAQLTTTPTALFDSLRGTTAWIPYLESRWRSGNDLITIPILIVNSTVLVGLGLAGIARRDNPHRAFLGLGLLVGLLMVTFGHSGPVEGWFAPEQRALLDGVLAPFRNVHKFDPVIRIPMVLGLGFLVDRTLEAWAAHRSRSQDATATPRLERLLDTTGRLGLVFLALAALVGTSLPALGGRLAPGQEFSAVPTYWSEAADWLDEQDAEGRALLVPGSSFASYAWGNTQDEPLQPLAESPWAVRSAMPLAAIGNVRSLDGIEDRLGQGKGSPELATYLRRTGVSYLVVRNDLERSANIIDPVLVHQTLADSPGIELAASFGPTYGGDARLETDTGAAIVNYGWQAEYPAVEIYSVGGPTHGPTYGAVSTRDLPVVIGAPEDLLGLTEQRVLGDQPTVLGYDADPEEHPAGPVVLTDGLRLRDRFFGRMHDAYSQTLTAAEAARVDDLRDYEVTTDADWQTTARLEGALDIEASSSLSESRTPGGTHLGNLPYAAVDGDSSTAWISRSDTSDLARLRLVLRTPVTVPTVTLTAGPTPLTASPLRVRTEAGVSDTVYLDARERVEVALPDGPTSWVQVEDASGSAGRQISIADLDVAGVSVTRWLVPPTVPAAWGAPDVISLDARPDARTGCARIGISVRCYPDKQEEGEETAGLRRLVTVPEGADYDVRLRAVPRAGAAIPRLLLEGRLVTVTGSSRSTTGASASSALGAVDGDPGTTWISASTDIDPSLDVAWLGKREVRGIQLELDPNAPARRPTAVTVSYPGGSQRVELDDEGRGTLNPVKVSRLSLLLNGSADIPNLSFDGVVSSLGVGISELTIEGLPEPLVPLGTEPVDLGCGSGPDLEVGPEGARLKTAVVGAPADIHVGLPVDLRVCGDSVVHLVEGANTIELGATDQFSPATVVLTRSDVTTPLPQDVSAASTDRAEVLQPSAGDDVVVERHNHNEGWTATQDGRPVSTLTIDGWQQGFAVDGDAGPVTTEFGPGTPYRLGLAVGGVTLLLTMLLYGWWRRRPPAARGDVLQESRYATGALVVGFAVGSGLVAGWAGLLVFALAGVALWVGRRRHDAVVSWVAVVPVAVVGAWNALQPWGSADGWYASHATTQLLMLVGLALVAIPFSGSTRPPEAGS